MRKPQVTGSDGPPGRITRSWAGAALGLLGLVAAGLGLPAQAAAQPAGPPLVDETFTGASAPAFEGFGNACLTGAPPSAAEPAPGTHPIGGCPAEEVGPVPPTDAAPHGYLRLTDDTHDESSAVLYNHALPANQGLDVSFDQWQYGGDTDPTADGISFFLIDGAASLTAPGAFGGSLGYAQKLPDDDPARPFLPGVNHGYLGVGLDVLGNYFGDWEHRGFGCPAGERSPAGTAFHVPAPGQNMVTLRGPGNGTEGYCFLTATTSNFSTTGPWPSTLPGSLHGGLTSLPPNVTPTEAETLLEPSRRRVDVHISPAPNPVVTVTVDFNDGTGPHQVLSEPAPTPVPSSYKFGFAASTGYFNDVHLLRNVVVRPAAELPELNVVKQVSAEADLPDVLSPGERVPFQYVVTNSGTTDLTDVTLNDDRVEDIDCPQTTLAAGESTTCTATYVVTAADGRAGSVTNTVTAHGMSDGTAVESPPGQVTLQTRTGPALELGKETDESKVYAAGDQVPYTYTVTNTGDTPLTGIAVDDDRATGVTCDDTTLDPGASTTCRGTYTVTDEDASQGSVTNTATAGGATADGTSVTSEPDSRTVLVRSELSLSLDKSADTSQSYHAGDQVPFDYTVRNTSNVALSDIAIDDSHVADVTCDDTTLAAGASTTCHGTYTVTDEDAGNGSVTNTATAHGRYDDTDVVSEPDSVTLDVARAAPGLSLVKQADVTRARAGDQVRYTYTVTNTGDTPLTGIAVNDDHVTDVTCDDTTLDPGASTTCRGTYTVTDEDASQGSVTNTATATADHGSTVSAPARATVRVEQKCKGKDCRQKPPCKGKDSHQH